MGDLNYRINLPPAKVLEYIQASAMKEHANFAIKPANGESSDELLNCGEADGWGPTWRDARFQDILERNFHKGDKSEVDETESIAPVLSGFRRMLSKIDLSSFGPRSFSASSLFRRQTTNPETPRPLGTSFLGLGTGAEESKHPMDLEKGSSFDPSILRRADLNAEEKNIWGWVADHDELSLAMKDGAVLFGFVEAPINFPPSFKWKEKGSAGNFTDMDVLKGTIISGSE